MFHLGVTSARGPDGGLPRRLLGITRRYLQLVGGTALSTVLFTLLLAVSFGVAAGLSLPRFAELVDQAGSTGQSTPVISLIVAGAWFLLPVAVLVLAGVVYSGLVVHRADAVARTRELRYTAALRATVRSMLAVVQFVITYIVGVLAALLLAPLVSLSALGYLLITRLRAGEGSPQTAERGRFTTWFCDNAAWLAIPFALAAALATGWLLGWPHIVLGQQRLGSALESGWRSSSGRRLRIGLALLAALVASGTVMWLALLPLAHGATSLWLLLGQYAVTIVVSPLVIAVVHSLYQGTGSGALGGPTRSFSFRLRSQRGVVLPVALCAALVLPLTPQMQLGAYADPPRAAESPTSTAVPELTATSITLEPVDHATFDLGGFSLSGHVESAGSAALTGAVELVATDTDEVETVLEPALTVAEDGWFSFDANFGLEPGKYRIRARYIGDERHLASTTEQQVTVLPGYVQLQPEILRPAEISVGDTVTVRLTADRTGWPTDLSLRGGVELLSAEDGVVLGRGVFSPSGVAELSFVMPAMSAQVAVRLVDEVRFHGDFEWVIEAQDAARASIRLDTPTQFDTVGPHQLTALLKLPSGAPANGTVEFRYANFKTRTSQRLGQLSQHQVGSPGAVQSTQFCLHSPSMPEARAAVRGCRDEDNPLLLSISDSNEEITFTVSYRPDTGGEGSVLGAEAGPVFVPLHPSLFVSEPTPPTPDRPREPGCVALELESRFGETPRFSIYDEHEPATQQKFTLRNRPLGSRCQFFDSNRQTTREGFLENSALSMIAPEVPGFQFLQWRAGPIGVIGTDRALQWRVPGDLDSVLISAEYVPLCVAEDVRITGHGTLVRWTEETLPPVITSRPAWNQWANCQTPEGASGWIPGSVIDLTYEGSDNPDTGEPDIFYGLNIIGDATATILGEDGEAEVGSVVGSSSVTIRYEVRGPAQVAVEFGPRCRQVEVIPAQPIGDDGPAHGTVITEPNCHNAVSSGYTVGSTVQVQSPELADPNLVVSGWLVNGEDQPKLGADSVAQTKVTRESTTTLAYRTTSCYVVSAQLQDATSSGVPANRRTRIETQPAPNCHDGSDRYLAGTEVSLVILRGDNSQTPRTRTFGGWVDRHPDAPQNAAHDAVFSYDSQNRIEIHGNKVTGSMEQNGDRHFTVTDDLYTTAFFYYDEACSQITVSGHGLDVSDVLLPLDSCGPGRYFDQAKMRLPSNGTWDGLQYNPRGEPRFDDPSAATRGPLTISDYRYGIENFPYTPLKFEVSGTDQMVQGKVRMSQSAPPGAGNWQWQHTEDLSCSYNDCWTEVRGDVRLLLRLCVVAVPDVRLQIAGDDSGKQYRPEDFGIDDFTWVVGDDDGCGDQSQFRSGTTPVLRADSPALGIEFAGFGEVENLVDVKFYSDQRSLEFYSHQDVYETLSEVGVQVEIGDDIRQLQLELNYLVHCGTLILDGPLAVLGPEPNCPAGEDGELRYVIGSFVQIVGPPENSEGRKFVEFRGAVIPDTTGITYTAPSHFSYDPANNNAAGGARGRFEYQDYYTALTLIERGTTRVEGWYQFPKSKWEKAGSAMARVGKLTLGALSSGLQAALPLCPPCAAAVASLELLEYGLRQIPGAGVVANIIAMTNPMRLVECTEQWGYGTLETSSALLSSDADAAKEAAKLAKMAGEFKKAVDSGKTYVEALEEMSKTQAGRKAGMAASFALSLYSNRHMNLEMHSNAADLRDTDAFASCLSDTWKDPTT